jgi:hypothetical protein
MAAVQNIGGIKTKNSFRSILKSALLGWKISAMDTGLRPFKHSGKPGLVSELVSGVELGLGVESESGEELGVE